MQQSKLQYIASQLPGYPVGKGLRTWHIAECFWETSPFTVYFYEDYTPYQIGPHTLMRIWHFLREGEPFLFQVRGQRITVSEDILAAQEKVIHDSPSQPMP
jgi:hypothetical protein